MGGWRCSLDGSLGNKEKPREEKGKGLLGLEESGDLRLLRN